jgi:adenylate cyclase
MERRLSAILAADVVGFTRLVRNDEAGTLSLFRQHKTELINDCISQHTGRVFKHTGDGFLAEFASVVNALNSALAIQRGMRIRNAGMPAESRLEFRMGINIGDVFIEEGDMLGNGVNVASRVEGLARAGGIAVTATVRDHVDNRISVIFEDAGEVTLKNIEHPLRIYHVRENTSFVVESKSLTKEADTRPSILVLPFANMSGDLEQDYFSDGITEDIITDLSKLRGLRVIARNSSFMYKGRAVDIQEVSHRFGVQAVLEGSVRKAGQRLRITAQLIRGSDGSHVWADRYDRSLSDVFEIQDDIGKRIVDQLKVNLLSNETSDKRTKSPEAYDLYLRARHLLRLRTRKGLRTARQLFCKAVETDHRFAKAYAGIADCDVYLRSWHGDDVSIATLLAVTGCAISLDAHLAEAFAARAYALCFAGKLEDASKNFEDALNLDPNSPDVCLSVGRFSFAQGDYAKAESMFRRMVALDPRDFRALNLLRKCLSIVGNNEEVRSTAAATVDCALSAIDVEDNTAGPLQVGAVGLAALGQSDRALDWIRRAMELDREDHNTKFNAACVYALVGEVDKARSLVAGYLGPLGEDEANWCRNDPDLASLRN